MGMLLPMTTTSNEQAEFLCALHHESDQDFPSLPPGFSLKNERGVYYLFRGAISKGIRSSLKEGRLAAWESFVVEEPTLAAWIIIKAQMEPRNE